MIKGDWGNLHIFRALAEREFAFDQSTISVFDLIPDVILDLINVVRQSYHDAILDQLSHMQSTN